MLWATCTTVKGLKGRPTRIKSDLVWVPNLGTHEEKSGLFLGNVNNCVRMPGHLSRVTHEIRPCLDSKIKGSVRSSSLGKTLTALRHPIWRPLRILGEHGQLDQLAAAVARELNKILKNSFHNSEKDPKMAHRLITSARRADRVLRNGLFTGNFNILAQVQPKRLELGQFLSQLSAHQPSNPTKGLGKPFGPKSGDKCAAVPAGVVGPDRMKYSSFSGGSSVKESVLVDNLNCLARFNKEQIQMIVDVDSVALPNIIALLNHPGVKVRMAAVLAVGNIIFHGTGDQVQAVLNCNVLSYFHNLLNHPDADETIFLGAMCILSVVTKENCAQVQAAIDAGLVPPIIHRLEKGELLTKRAAASAVNILADNGNEEQVARLIDCGVIPPFCSLLNSEDLKLMKIVLAGIRSILDTSFNQDGRDNFRTLIEECGGLDQIASLQNHENKEIRDIIAYYFSDVTRGR